ncbi:unnamed protein product [Strongylus vulgaris]|uniref:Ubiquitin carboxyl-terminal hydrolase 36 n=1 Tax=Strongylus vulgaris TaxID=40348 RepID=A0A3P7J3Q8_STRVU|nr:unnamed protein product [Strongylus vulgaris]
MHCEMSSDKELPNLDGSETAECTMVMEESNDVDDRLFDPDRTPSHYGYDTTPERSTASPSLASLWAYNGDCNTVCSEEDSRELQKLDMRSISPSPMDQDESCSDIFANVEESGPSCSVTDPSTELPDILSEEGQMPFEKLSKQLPWKKADSGDSGAVPCGEITSSIEEKLEGHGSPASIRVRRLSEKGKIEQKFPVLDPQLKDIWDFNNFSPVKNLKRAEGIWNSAQHCFMIAVMQTLVHTAPFVRFIVDKHNHNHGSLSGRCFCCDLKKHVFRVLRINGVPHRMDWILVHWRRLFGGDYFTTQEDAHEFLIKVLDLVDRCSCPPSALKDTIPKGPSPPMMQLFGFKLRYQLVCLTCGNSSVSYALHNDLSVHLPRHSNNMGVPPKMRNLIALYMKEEVLDYACSNNRCGGKRAKRKPYILRAPSVLILQIKRFLPNGKKNSMKVQVEEHLSLKEFSYSQTEKDDYELTAIISHEGYRLYSGHYTALVRGYDRQFYFFNDEYVRPQRLLTANLCPYVVVYSRKGPQERIFASPVKSRVELTTPTTMLSQQQSKPSGISCNAHDRRKNGEGISVPSNIVHPQKQEHFRRVVNKFDPKLRTNVGVVEKEDNQSSYYCKDNGKSGSGINFDVNRDRETMKVNGFISTPSVISLSPSKTVSSYNGKSAEKNNVSSIQQDHNSPQRATKSFSASPSKHGLSSLKTKEHPTCDGYYTFTHDDVASRKKPRLH